MTDRFLVEVEDLLGRFAVRHRGNINGEDVGHVETSPGGLQREKSRHQSTRAREKHEGGADLSDGKDALAPAGAACNADAAAGDVQAVGLIRRRQPRDEGQNDSGNDGERRSDPQQDEIDGQFQRANGEARGVARQNRNERLRAQYPDCGAGTAKEKAFGQ